MNYYYRMQFIVALCVLVACVSAQQETYKKRSVGDYNPDYRQGEKILVEA